MSRWQCFLNNHNNPTFVSDFISFSNPATWSMLNNIWKATWWFHENLKFRIGIPIPVLPLTEPLWPLASSSVKWEKDLLSGLLLKSISSCILHDTYKTKWNNNNTIRRFDPGGYLMVLHRKSYDIHLCAQWKIHFLHRPQAQRAASH